MLQLTEFALLALAGYRGTQLLVHDSILDPVRDHIDVWHQNKPTSTARTVATAFTQHWLRPILEAEGVEDWRRWLVWYDTSPLRVRTNRSETALQAFDRGVISPAALRRETGFDDSDAPTAQEIQDRDRRSDDGQDTDDNLPVDESEAPPDTLPASAHNGCGPGSSPQPTASSGTRSPRQERSYAEPQPAPALSVPRPAASN